MDKIIKLTERDISRMVKQVLNEMDWRTTRDAFNKHDNGSQLLMCLANDIDNILEKFEPDGEYEIMANQMQSPIREKIEEFKGILSQYGAYCERKCNQLEKFDKYSREGFQQEFGKTPSELEDDLGEKENDIFSRYMNDELGFNDYIKTYRDYENSPEYQAVHRFNNY